MSNARFGLRVRNGLVRSITEGQQAIFLDPDAVAFLTAAGITDPTITSAIDTLVVSLKNFGIWTKMRAIYPFVGGTASTHKWNLKDPRDLDIAFRILFNGGVIHNQNGVTFNGVNSYGDTRLNVNLNLLQNNNSQSIYSRTLPTTLNNYNGANPPGFLLGSFATGTTIEAQSNQNTSIQISTTFLGLISLTRRSSGLSDSVELYKNGISIANNNSISLTPTNNNYWIGAVNNNGSMILQSTYNISYASLGDGLSDTETANLYTAVQTFQTTLGRQV